MAGTAMEPRRCPQCHQLYVPVQKHQVYCRLACRVAAFHEREIEAKARELLHSLYGGNPNADP